MERERERLRGRVTKIVKGSERWGGRWKERRRLNDGERASEMERDI